MADPTLILPKIKYIVAFISDLREVNKTIKTKPFPKRFINEIRKF